MFRRLVDPPEVGPWRIARDLPARLDVDAIGHAAARRRGVEATLAWIFAILALPGVGSLGGSDPPLC